MSLVAPWFLLGCLLLALPVWLHRLQTQSSERKPFGSTMLLERTEEQVHVRRQLKYYVLLALRLLLLALIAAAFAKPFLERPPAPLADPAAGTRVVVVDVSASMGRSGVLEQALQAARDAVDSAPTGAAIAIFSAAGRLETVAPPGTDRAGHRRAVDRLVSRPERLDYGRLGRELEALATSLQPPVDVHLVSDFQASGMPARFADAVPRGIASLVLRPAGRGDPVNWHVEAVTRTEDGLAVTLRCRGSAERTADVELWVNGERRDSATVAGPGTRTVPFPVADWADGDNRVEVVLVADDDLGVDNRYYAVVTNDPPLPVPLLTTAADGRAETYLAAALTSADDEGYAALPMRQGEFDPRVLSRYRWAIVTDLGAVGDELAAGLASFVDAGGGLLAFVASDPAGAGRLPVTGHALRPADLAASASGVGVPAAVETRHPVTGATDGWHRVSVTRQLPVDPAPEDRVLVRLDDGRPLVIERDMGRGRMLLVLSDAGNRWNDLPVHPVFVGFILAAAGHLDGREALQTSHVAGDTLPLGTAGQVVGPGGEALVPLAQTGRIELVRLEQPGLYTVYTAQGESLIAANVDARESDFRPLDDDALARWQAAAKSGSNRAAAPASGSPQVRTVELWPWLLLMLVLLAVAESAVGNARLAARAEAR